MRVWALNPPADHGVKQVREGRCMQRGGAWTTIWTPLSMAYCASMARSEGHDAFLNDCIVEDIDFLDVTRRAAELKPDLVVMNAVTPSFDSDLTTVEAVKAVSELYSPVAGEVVAVNERLDGEPALVNSDPYGDGWMIRLKVKGEHFASGETHFGGPHEVRRWLQELSETLDR